MSQLQFDPSMLQAPIPGQSLTKEPGNYPWEVPPELSTIEDVIEYYTERLLDANADDAILVCLDGGISVEKMAEFITTSGTMNGRHSLDLAFLVDPYVRELIKYVADSANADYIESYSDLEKEKQVPYRQIRSLIKEMHKQQPEETVENIEEEMPPQQKGLMAKLKKEN